MTIEVYYDKCIALEWSVMNYWVGGLTFSFKLFGSCDTEEDASVSLNLVKRSVSLNLVKGSVSLNLVKGSVSLNLVKGSVSLNLVKGSVSLNLVKVHLY